MKKHFGKTVLCLMMVAMCAFSLSFGIFAVIMTANMKMSLTVGYKAYNCSANVSGVITGASLVADGTPSDINLSNVVVNGKNNQTQSMNLGTFYFTTEGVKNVVNKPYPIKVWFTIENTSAFPFCVDVNLPTITDVEVIADKTSHVIPAGETDTIMVTFTLLNIESTSLESGFSSSGLSFTFRKFLKTKVDIPVYKDSSVTFFENHPYYIKTGNYHGEAELIWLVGGTIDANGQTVALTDADRTQLDTGKFDANKDYYIISARTLYGNSTRGRIVAQNNFYYGNATDMSLGAYLLEYPNISDITDYSLSTLRQYLIGHTVKDEHVKDSTNKYILPNESGKDSQPLQELYDIDLDIYALIKKRSLSSIYQTLGYQNKPLAFPTDKVDNLTANEADAFWIPTGADVAVLGDDFRAYTPSGTAGSWMIFTKASSSGNHLKITYYGENEPVSTQYVVYNIYCKYRPAFIL